MNSPQNTHLTYDTILFQEIVAEADNLAGDGNVNQPVSGSNVW